MDGKTQVDPAEQDGDEYRTPVLIAHGTVASLTAGPDPGSADIGAQTSTLPGDTSSG